MGAETQVTQLERLFERGDLPSPEFRVRSDIQIKAAVGMEHNNQLSLQGLQHE